MDHDVAPGPWTRRTWACAIAGALGGAALGVGLVLLLHALIS